MEASITLKKVGKLVGDKTVLAGLTFGIERGSLVAIVGVNDSGKTTLLKLLSGFENPNFGQVFIHGLDMDKRRQETRKLIGYMPHENDLDPWLTLEQNIRFTANLYKVSKSTASALILRYADALNLTQYLNELAMNVSHGTQKKTMLVRELVHDLLAWFKISLCSSLCFQCNLCKVIDLDGISNLFSADGSFFNLVFLVSKVPTRYW